MYRLICWSEYDRIINEENVFLNKKVEVFPFTIPIDNINEVKKIEVKKIELYYW